MRLRKLAIRTGVAGAFCLLFAAAALVWDGCTDEITRADAAVVFGNTVHADGTPSSRLKARLDKVLELHQRNLFPLVIVSGGFGKEGHDEAIVMRDYLVQHGVSAEQIITDSRGLTTWATAENTGRILRARQLESALVVSQYFHIPRAKLAFRRHGIQRVYSAHPRYFELRDLYSIPRELVGICSYAVRRLSPAHTFGEAEQL